MFDVIVSNPPYVSTAEYNAIEPEVRNFEPRTALEAGPLGTEVIARLIPQAGERLLAGGSLLLEISPMIHNNVCQLVAADGRFEPATTVKDLAGHARVVQATRRK